jgi:hypothetical protein
MFSKLNRNKYWGHQELRILVNKVYSIFYFRVILVTYHACLVCGIIVFMYVCYSSELNSQNKPYMMNKRSNFYMSHVNIVYVGLPKLQM